MAQIQDFCLFIQWIYTHVVMISWAMHFRFLFWIFRYFVWNPKRALNPFTHHFNFIIRISKAENQKRKSEIISFNQHGMTHIHFWNATRMMKKSDDWFTHSHVLLIRQQQMHCICLWSVGFVSDRANTAISSQLWWHAMLTKGVAWKSADSFAQAKSAGF